MRRILLAVVGLAALGALLVLGWSHTQQKARVEQKPALALLTSLPILFGEQFSLNAPGSPLRTSLELEYQLHPIGVADGPSLKGQSLLFMAHARAQPAPALADLDHWVRDGGHLLILTDPLLSWHSERGLGDSLRPPINFADTALLAHWGLALSGPDANGPMLRTIGGAEVMTASPGTLSSSGSCAVEDEGFVARCAIGKGRVTVIADSDWLNVGDGEGALDGPTDRNLDALSRELARLRNP